MYVCAKCLNRFRMYDEDEERHTETCPHCGSEYFDHYSDEDEDEDEMNDYDKGWYDFMVDMAKGR